MALGYNTNANGLNAQVGKLAVQLREAMSACRDMATYVNGIQAAGLEALGFSAADATSIMTLVNYMSTVAGCYHGTVQQGGTGGTGAVTFDFDNALSVLWGGQ